MIFILRETQLELNNIDMIIEDNINKKTIENQENNFTFTYLKRYYPEKLDHARQEHLKNIYSNLHEWMNELLIDPKESVDFGSGPTIYQFLPILNSKIISVEKDINSITSLKDWVKGKQAYDWSETINVWNKLTNNNLTQEIVQEKLKENLSHIQIDATHEILSTKVDFVQSYFCVESISKNQDEFNLTLKNILSTTKKHALFLCLKNQDQWYPRAEPSYPVDIEQFTKKLGLNFLVKKYQNLDKTSKNIDADIKGEFMVLTEKVFPYPIYVRPASIEDIDNIYKIQIKNYPSGLHEERHTLRRIVESYQQGCFILEDRQAKKFIGYMLSHPCKYTKFNSSQIDTQETEEYFAHDMCVNKEYRTGNMSKIIDDFLVKIAKSMGFKYYNAVVVGRNVQKYQQMGFEKVKDVNYGQEQGILVKKQI